MSVFRRVEAACCAGITQLHTTLMLGDGRVVSTLIVRVRRQCPVPSMGLCLAHNSAASAVQSAHCHPVVPHCLLPNWSGA